MRKIALLAGLVAASGLSSFALAGHGVVPVAVDSTVAGGTVANPGGPEASTLYENLPVGAETVMTTGSTPRTTGGDEFIVVGSPSQHSALLTSMKFGFSVAAGTTAFDARVRIFDDIDYLATTTTQFTNLKADFTLSFTGQTTGAFITTPIDLTTLPGGGVTITDNPANNDTITSSSAGFMDAFVVLSFLNPGTSTNVTNNGVTFIFDSSGVNIGAAYDTAGVTAPNFGGTQADAVYWRDADGNQTIIGNEARSFAAPTRANFAMSFDGNILPEPTSLAALSLGGLFLRRRRA